MTALKHRMGEEVENPSAFSTPIIVDRRSVAVVGRLIRRERMALGTGQSVRVQHLEQQIMTGGFIQQVVKGPDEHRRSPFASLCSSLTPFPIFFTSFGS